MNRRAAEWYADLDPVLHAEHPERDEDPEPRSSLSGSGSFPDGRVSPRFDAAGG
jgi:hypothetical protein